MSDPNWQCMASVNVVLFLTDEVPTVEQGAEEKSEDPQVLMSAQAEGQEAEGGDEDDATVEVCNRHTLTYVEILY